MLRSLKELKRYVLSARDGEIGHCHDFLFDDDCWTVRYMVADTSKWLLGRRVLISPMSLGKPDWASRRFTVDLDRDQVKQSPPLDSDAPVTRQYERSLQAYYGWAHYWGGPQAWGAVSTPTELRGARVPPRTESRGVASEQTQLRSMREVIGYEVSGTDGKVGKVDDFIVDDTTWTLHYLVVDTGKWLISRRVLFSIQWLEAVNWVERRADVGLSVEQIKGAPPFEATQPVNRELETRIYDYYGRPYYWASSQSRTG